MATNFPTSLDTLVNPTGTDTVATVDHAAQHANANDAIEALEAKVGVDGSVDQDTHDYKLSGVLGAHKALADGADQTVSGNNTFSGNQTFNSGKLRATRPQITTSIDDSNGNEVIKITPTASAVNEVQITNSTVGNAPLIDPSGGDTNIPLKVKGKGTGKVMLGDAELQFPDVDGSASQVLQTDGLGVLSWSSVGSTTTLVTANITQAVGSSTSDTTLYSTTIPANTLSTANAIRVWIPLSNIDTDPSGGGAGSVAVYLKYGGTTVSTLSLGGIALSGNTRGSVEFILAGNGTTSSQKAVGYGQAFGDEVNVQLVDVGTGTASVASTSSQTLVVSTQASGAGCSITAEGFIVSIMRAV